jgi:DNA-directed RNA polymerase beta subunit
MFSDVSTELCEQLYKEHGIQDYGCCDMYNGDTGEKLKARIFVAPTFYMRLQKFAVTAKYVVN